MIVTLPDEQTQEIALAWIKAQQREPDGYKKVLDVLLMGAHFAVWSWLDALRYAVTKCGKAYFVDSKHILEELA
jgi:hypothetical protein